MLANTTKDIVSVTKGAQQATLASLQSGEQEATENIGERAETGLLTTEKVELVEFNAVGEVEKNTFDDQLFQALSLSVSSRENRSHSIMDILSRPYQVSTFQWSQTDTFNSLVETVEFPETLFAQDNIQKKLIGFTFLRCKAMEIRVLINAQPFQQGRLLVYFSPYRRLLDGTRSSEITMTGKTGFDHVNIDISETQEVTFTVPYVAPFPVMNLIRNSWNVGSFVYTIYAPLQGGTESSVTVTTWARFIDPEPLIPTSAYPYFATPPVRKRTQAQLQFGGEKSAATGSISKMTSAVGHIASKFKDVPMISSIAGAVSAAASLATGIASAFGWSKPTIDSGMTPVQQSIYRYANTYNGGDASKNMGLDFTNQIIQAPVYGRDVDEMALSYIARRPNFVLSYTWREDLPAGATIFRELVTPLSSYLATPITDQLPNRRQLPHLAYVANLFEYWRGGITYNIKFAKTKYHSGRLQICLIPKGYDQDNFDPSMMYTEIVDIASVSEYSFTVPFVYEKPWCLNRRSDTGAVPGLVPTLLVVKALTQLRRPNDVVADNVELFLEVGGAEDIEFALPRNPRTQFQNLAATPPPPSKVAQLQIGFSSVDSPVFGSDNKLSDTLHGLTVGEKIVSVKQLLHRAQDVQQISGATSCHVRPLQTDSIDPDIVDATSNTFFDAIAPLFAFNRGSVRVKSQMYDDNGNVAPSWARGFFRKTDWPSATLKFATAATGDEGDWSRLTHNAYGQSCLALEGALELELPYYGTTPIRPNNTTPIHPDAILAMDLEHYELFTACSTSIVAQRFMRSVGDDFSFGFLYGVPIVALSDVP
jgi:hypothetical protein